MRQWNTAILLKAHSCERRIHFYVTVLGDIDPEFNVVEVTDEAKEKLSKIKNKIGGFGCKLCKQEFEDAFGLAQHRYLFSFHAQSEKYHYLFSVAYKIAIFQLFLFTPFVKL